MKLRPPSVPVITVDPYFSIWSAADRLYDKNTEHWTGAPNTIKGTFTFDDKTYRFMGEGDEESVEQVFLDVNALCTRYLFKNDLFLLSVNFFTPLFTDDLYRLSRPVSYVQIKCTPFDSDSHKMFVEFEISEELCVNVKGEKKVSADVFENDKLRIVKMGCEEQDILSKSGDDLRIDWGYFYAAADSAVTEISVKNDEFCSVTVKTLIKENAESYVLFAYDDIYSINYFGEFIESYWKKVNSDIISVLNEAYCEAGEMFDLCMKKSREIEYDALIYGGEEYSDLLSLAYRQVIAAHKIAVDPDGEIVFISKECFSNGCAATVDVTYPSSPFFIHYNTELLKGMLRPIFKFASSDEWEFDFAPHDAGQYPLVLGQVYGTNHIEDGRYLEFQMPVEECGNMLIMMTNIALKDGNTKFFDKYSDTLADWVRYLIEYGMDPENQLCTDDFAGHLAHNCNLSLKAIMGIAGYSILLRMKRKNKEADKYFKIAKNMADNWVNNAANDDGSFRLTFDREDTFSMKYNIIWDKIWQTGLFAPCIYYSEFCSYKKHINAYGLPLDNRKTYTKSDWLMWVGVLAPTKEEFIDFIKPMWNCYNSTPSRVPLTDWYDTVTSEVVGFRHRSVLGGFYIKFLEDTLI